jgi:mono/diheme cytochrome c family protein
MKAAIRNRIGLGLLGGVLLLLAIGVATTLLRAEKSAADPDNAQQVTLGKPLYDQHCQSCHGAGFEGQPNWRERLPNGRMPAPPHDASGHTWHHPDTVLFSITRDGLVPGRTAPPGYQSDMPAFGGKLTDGQIWAVLAYIKSSWPPEVRTAQREATLRQGQR